MFDFVQDSTAPAPTDAPVAISSSGLQLNDLLQQEFLKSSTIDDRRLVLSYALGLVLGRSLALPSAPVESGYNYWLGNNEDNARVSISNFNEKIIIDTDTARAFAAQVWQLRYYAAHGDKALLTSEIYGFFDTMMGVAHYVDEKTHAFVNANKVVIFSAANYIRDHMQEKQA